jgi:hypothetical protein
MLRIRIAPDKPNVENDAVRMIMEQVARRSSVPQIPAVERAHVRQTCVTCNDSFWHTNEYASFCSRECRADHQDD